MTFLKGKSLIINNFIRAGYENAVRELLAAGANVEKRDSEERLKMLF